MNSLRKASWFPWLSVLLLSVWIPIQAAGCCKLAALVGLDLSDWFGKAAPEAIANAAPETREKREGPAMAPDHSCCPRTAATVEASANSPAVDPFQASQMEGKAAPGFPNGNQARPCEGGDQACCLKDAGPVEPGLASTPASSAAPMAMAAALLHAKVPPAVDPLRFAHPPEDPGPPIYLVQLRLLI